MDNHLSIKMPKINPKRIGQLIIITLVLTAGYFFYAQVFGATTMGKSINTAGTLEEGLVGHWTFDGPDMISNVADVSGQGNNGNLVGFTSTTTVSGKVGQALDFDGVDDYVSINTISISSDITVSVWVKSSNFNQNGFIVGKNPVNTQWELFFQGANLIWRGGGVENTTVCTIPSNGEWHHVVGKQTGTSASLYIDGVECGTGTLTAIGNGSGDVEIGRFNSNYYFAGAIDNVRIYNRGLSADEITQLYNSTKGNVTNKTPTPKTSLTTGLVGHWTFDGPKLSATTATDSSGQGNNGTLTNGPAPIEGKLGQALNFDGVNDTVSVGDPAVLDIGTNDFTITAWVKTSYTGIQQIVAKRGGSGGVGYDTRISAGKLFSYIRDVDDAGYNTGASISNNYADGKWHFVVFAFNRDATVTYYKDGIADGTDDISANGASLASTNNLYIASNDGTGAYFNGNLDDIRIYDRLLTPAEITQLYNSTKGNVTNKTPTPKTSLTTGLAGHWTFDGPKLSATTATDSSGQGNNGTLTNGPAPIEGKLGQALDFDGVNDYVDAGNGASLEMGTGDMAVSAWVKLKPIQLNTKSGIVSKGATISSDEGYVFSYDSDNNRLMFWISDGTTRIWPVSSVGLNLNDDSWHFVVANADRDADVTFYLDGVGVGSSDMSSFNGVDITNSGRNISIGRWNNNAYYLNGSIDDPRIYNRLLTTDEITQLYNLGR